jgi:hypothetical protein
MVKTARVLAIVPKFIRASFTNTQAIDSSAIGNRQSKIFDLKSLSNPLDKSST